MEVEKDIWFPIGNTYSGLIHDFLLVKDYLSDKSYKFIDVGSGYGNILTIARCVFPYNVLVEGVEMRDDCVRASSLQHKVIYGDAFHLKYFYYDIIYFFQPIIDEKKELELEKKILREMNSGGILMHYSSIFHKDKLLSRYVKEVFEKINNHILIKK